MDEIGWTGPAAGARCRARAARRARGIWLPAALALLLVGGARHLPASGAGSASAARTPPASGPDAAVTDVARALAGLPSEPGSRLERVEGQPAWREHQAEFDRNWVRLEANRLGTMRAWRDRELARVDAACETLFYPFSGPDFLNAFVLFPGCTRYLLFGLEPVGSIPPLDRAPAPQVESMLEQVRASLADLFVRDYFITKTMTSELRTREIDGTLPLLLVFLARVDARITDVAFEAPWDEPHDASRPADSGAAVRRSGGRPAAVTIRFTLRGSTRPQTLVYARVNLEDVAVSKQTALRSYLGRVAPFTTLLKSASYLLHDNQFSTVRSLVLSGSRAVLEDDTGVPYRFFDQADWDITLFGRYSRPVKDFNYGRQPDLEAAYRATPAPRNLPFSFGYHWRDGASSVILAVRRKTPL